jgi:GNAT superfamily N-acetyltransferase
VKAIACELPAKFGLPLSRFSRAELRRHVLATGLVAEISGMTIWRWLREDAIRPWAHRSWIFPRDPDFGAKAGLVLDLYHRRWHGQSLGPHDFVLSADEKTQIQLTTPRDPIAAPAPGHPMRVSSDYRRHGTGAYLAAWDVHRARLFGHVVPEISIDAFDALVADVMRRAPYRTARRVFWVVDNGTIHRGTRAVDRLRARWPNLILVHLPVHASWLNQVEIYFSILQRKALTPSDFPTLLAAANRILGFQRHYQRIAEPFEWRFTRRDLTKVLARCSTRSPQRLAA